MTVLDPDLRRRQDETGVVRWAAALVAAVLLHAGVGVLLWMPSESAGESSGGPVVIELVLGSGLPGGGMRPEAVTGGTGAPVAFPEPADTTVQVPQAAAELTVPDAVRTDATPALPYVPDALADTAADPVQPLLPSRTATIVPANGTVAASPAPTPPADPEVRVAPTEMRLSEPAEVAPILPEEAALAPGSQVLPVAAAASRGAQRLSEAEDQVDLEEAPVVVASLSSAVAVAPEASRSVQPAEAAVTRFDVMPPAPVPQRSPAPPTPERTPPAAPPQQASVAPADQPTSEEPVGAPSGAVGEGTGMEEGPAFGDATGPGADVGGSGPGESGPSAAAAASAQNDYFAALNAHLARHKQYPSLARSRNQEGVVMLYLAIDAAGGVTAARVDQTSGYQLLDEAALEMVWRAAPLPPIPADLGRSSLALVVPVQYSLY